MSVLTCWRRPASRCTPLPHLASVSASLTDAVDFHLNKRAAGVYLAGALIFAGQERVVGTTKNAAAILKGWKESTAGRSSEEKL